MGNKGLTMTDADYQQALIEAIQAKSPLLVQLCLQYTLPLNDIHVKGTPLLHEAAKIGNKKVLVLLLQAGIDPEVTNTQGQFAYMIASQHGHGGSAAILEQWLLKKRLVKAKDVLSMYPEHTHQLTSEPRPLGPVADDKSHRTCVLY